MLRDYLMEREGLELYETDKGFATFLCDGAELYIRDIYVARDYRRTKVGTEIAEAVIEIGRKRGCQYVSGTVSLDAKGITESFKAILSFGFEVYGYEPGKRLFIFKKNLHPTVKPVPAGAH